MIAAAITSAVALTGSAVSRATGGCYASCVHGTVCNPRTGLCDRLPCDGRCGSNEYCERRGGQQRCVSRLGGSITIQSHEDDPDFMTDTSTAGR